MRQVRYLLIGGGLASQRAAAKLRELDAGGPVLLVAREDRLPYDRPPLSKDFLLGKTPADKLALQPPEWYRERNVEVLLGQSVEELDARGKTARLSDGQAVRFEKALLATGGRPTRLNVAGADLPGVHYLRTLDDSAAISAAAVAGRRAVIVGGGFIGMELASSLAQRGVAVTLLERGDRIWRRFADERISRYFEDAAAARGVAILKNERVVAIEGAGRAESVRTADGKRLPCDFVCVAVGIVPNVELAERAGLAMDDGILVNEHLQTSHPDVYAAGDVARFPDPYAGRPRRVEHWGGADYGGTLAGANLAGGTGRYDLLTYVWSDLFERHLEFAGDEAPPESTLLRGAMTDASFALLYLRGGRLTAYYAVNYKRKQYLVLQKLIKARVNLSGREAQLQDPALDPAALLPPEPPKQP